MAGEETMKKKNPAVKISPWTLARLNAEEVSKAAAEAIKKSKILQPVVRRETPFGLGMESSYGGDVDWAQGLTATEGELLRGFAFLQSYPWSH